jgi:hypothetical protein
MSYTNLYNPVGLSKSLLSRFILSLRQMNMQPLDMESQPLGILNPEKVFKPFGGGRGWRI